MPVLVSRLNLTQWFRVSSYMYVSTLSIMILCNQKSKHLNERNFLWKIKVFLHMDVESGKQLVLGS